MLKGRIYLLDLLRIYAASLVMVYHYSGRWGHWIDSKNFSNNYYHTHPESLFTQFAMGGFVGVYIFFIISGFVITYTARNSSYLGFLRSRLMRIYKPFLPILIISWIFSILLYGRTQFNSWLALLKSFIISPIQKNGDIAVMGSAWTLYHEMLFYTFIFTTLVFFLN